jgi:hypothetical protein
MTRERNGVQWFPASRECQNTEVIKQGVGTRCISDQIEEAAVLQTLRQAFEWNLVPLRLLSTRGGHYAPEIGRRPLQF